jgi:hypothetical protein
VIYQDPLAYLLGLEGIALLDAWAGDHDRGFTEARLAEIRRLLDDQKLRDRGVPAQRVSTITAYQQQSASYDAQGGRRAVRHRRAGRGRLPQRPGARRGAGCRLRDRPVRRVPRQARASGHRHRQLTGHARPRAAACPRRRVPGGEFHVAELGRLPLPDDSVDVIVCALALVHVPRLWPVLAEFARVLPPGGDLIISDVHHDVVTRGSVIKAGGPAGEPCIAATCRHRPGDYLRAALSLGLQARRCEEPAATGTGAPLPVPATETGNWRD